MDKHSTNTPFKQLFTPEAWVKKALRRAQECQQAGQFLQAKKHLKILAAAYRLNKGGINV